MRREIERTLFKVNLQKVRAVPTGERHSAEFTVHGACHVAFPHRSMMGQKCFIFNHSCPKQLLAAALLDRGRSPAAWLWRPETLPQGPQTATGPPPPGLSRPTPAPPP